MKGEMLTVLVVVAHLGLFGLRSVTGRVNGLFDDVYLLVEGRARSRGVNGGAGDVGRLVVDGPRGGGVDGVLVDVGGSLEAGAVRGGVDGGADYAELVAVVGLDTGTILALGNVDDSVGSAVLLVVGVGGLRSDVGRMDG
jgi:hypothetical protein